MGGTAPDDPVDDGGIVVAVPPDEGEELGGKNVVLLKKRTVATAAKHEGGGQFAAEFRAGLRNQTREPGDAADGGGFGRQRAGVEDDGEGEAALDVEEVVAAHGFDGEGGLAVGLAVVVAVLGVVVEVLAGEAVRREKSDFVRGEKLLEAALAGGVAGDRLFEEGVKLAGEVVVFQEGDGEGVDALRDG